jgi:hypothetical protein
MTNSQRIEKVRHTLQRWYEAEHEPTELQFEESILIRDGFYCGRRFRFGPYSAIWFIEENQLKIFDERGALQLTVGLDETGNVKSGVTSKAA